LDVAEMAQAVIRILNDQDYRSSLGSHAKAKVADLCDVEIIAPKIYDVIKKIVQ